MAGTREKKALLVFVMLMLFGLLCIYGYIAVGHNWNYTASDLDDTFGDMGDYTVILYEGTIEPSETDTTQVSITQRIQNKLNQWFNFDTDAKVSEEEAEELGGVSLLEDELPDPGSDMQKAVQAYREKGATVFALDLSSSNAYEEGSILQRGDTRIAIMGVYSLQSLASLQAQVDHYRTLDIDKMIVVTDNLPLLAGVRGIDIVIQACTTMPEDWDFAAQGRYITVAPEKNTIAATVITGSIASTKIL